MRWRSILWLEFCCLSATCILPQLFNKIINFHWKVFASLRKSIEIPIWLRIQIDSAGISANTMNCSDCSLEAIMTAIRFPFSWWSWCCCLSNLVLVLVPGFLHVKDRILGNRITSPHILLFFNETYSHKEEKFSAMKTPEWIHIGWFLKTGTYANNCFVKLKRHERQAQGRHTFFTIHREPIFNYLLSKNPPDSQFSIK